MKMEYFNWIYLTDANPIWQTEELTEEELERKKKIEMTVNEKINQLTDEEKEVIEKHYYEGVSFVKIAAGMNKPIYTIMNIHVRAIRILKKMLAKFVEKEYGIKREKNNCPICNSENRDKAEKLIIAKKQEEPYRFVIRKLKEKYGIKISSPQTIIGHIKYH